MSGNPAGRPRKEVSLTSIVKLKLGEKVSSKSDQTWGEAIAEAWLLSAAFGSSQHLKEILERVDGKVALPLTGKDSGPLRIETTYVSDETMQAIRQYAKILAEKLQSKTDIKDK